MGSHFYCVRILAALAFLGMAGLTQAQKKDPPWGTIPQPKDEEFATLKTNLTKLGKVSPLQRNLPLRTLQKRRKILVTSLTAKLKTFRNVEKCKYGDAYYACIQAVTSHRVDQATPLLIENIGVTASGFPLGIRMDDLAKYPMVGALLHIRHPRLSSMLLTKIGAEADEDKRRLYLYTLIHSLPVLADDKDRHRESLKLAEHLLTRWGNEFARGKAGAARFSSAAKLLRECPPPPIRLVYHLVRPSK